ncbi:MAG: LacI family DNA-binding transcriptional regulator [Kiritimatiellae bacterium]|nr:LacI family DNA-binding transcriptional regulator [Kiritimatiellia bacterium]MDD5522993.1 LacI family DNA-binding transcriptional regulator [Kiritimatiellia bacterium]
MSRISIKDIAKKAGVCIGTVSRVINNMDRVHPKTREKIRRIIENTGYRPSSMGRALVSGRTHNVLVVVHNIADPYCAAISKLFSGHWHSLGYKMLLGDSNYDAELEREHLVRARDGSVDGLIVSPIPGRTNILTYREMIKSRFPFIAIDNRAEGARTNCVKYDDHSAASIAIEYLAKKGHKHIAFANSRLEYQTVKDRQAGYLETMHRMKLSVREEFLTPLPKPLPETAETIQQLMRQKPAPTALLAENEIMATVCINTLLRSGFKVPDDVAVIAIGDTLTDHFSPVPMTTVSLRQDLMCQKAVEVLSLLINNPKMRSQSPAQEIIQPELIVRQSA